MRPFPTDEKFIGLVWHVGVLAIVAGLVIWPSADSLRNCKACRIATGFG
jgi:hypothetical protein